jgi:hypothetical protein
MLSVGVRVEYNGRIERKSEHDLSTQRLTPKPFNFWTLKHCFQLRFCTGFFACCTKGLVFEDASTTTLILRWLVHLQKRAPS